MKTTGLDYTFVQSDGEFQVWTPDSSGAVLGSGKTRIEAMKSAINNMVMLSAELNKAVLYPKSWNPESQDE